MERRYNMSYSMGTAIRDDHATRKSGSKGLPLKRRKMERVTTSAKPSRSVANCAFTAESAVSIEIDISCGQMTVPRSSVGMVIGTYGTTTKRITIETGALIQFKEDGESYQIKVFIIRGTPQQIYSPQQVIREMIGDVPPKSLSLLNGVVAPNGGNYIAWLCNDLHNAGISSDSCAQKTNVDGVWASHGGNATASALNNSHTIQSATYARTDVPNDLVQYAKCCTSPLPDSMTGMRLSRPRRS
ncbi:hypothetical protein KIN20_009127 [Parelaphostrongylus tenuis]|uniref:K Homology domain-containing protein n=1 Tax=Parelaphostrongylus tenuis TaxID=148309 RepID=A0AAD5QJD6_PARTN|nr:hypothetical protein KIN20_009127 [Parelaphostrongylus tenuis]